ncbi:MAG: DUF4301 family protein [Bacteroidales bacterium]|nr:DUF4301 family protein [Bacteroidales bacterium]
MTQEEQIKRFKEGFPYLDIVDAATPSNGIKVLASDELKEALEYYENASVKGKCKFVPASGAASRMFKDVFAHKAETISKLAGNIEKFAFYSPDVFGTAPYDPDTTADRLLGETGLDYGNKPKGVLKFHRYPSEVRTAFAEHLVEGAEYMRNADNTVNLTVTISPEHRQLFEDAFSAVKDEYESRYGVKYNVRFVYQSKDTDTIAVTPDNKPFLKEDGTVLRRPAGHGAPTYTLNDAEEDLASIKNPDNVSVERNLETTSKYKKVLMGRALMLRDTVFGFLTEFEQMEGIPGTSIPLYMNIPGYNAPKDDPYATPEFQQLCNEIETFLKEEFCVTIPMARSCRERALMLKAKLNRPLRVCGMVRNEGEPGGGPFIIRAKDGSTSLQILESVQIEDASMMKNATHFNPVDIVCCLRDVKGEKFNLLEFVDPETGFISSKSYQGRELKALELPGLWNGAMSDWLTAFVEVPVETFNPVKVVLDLLKDAHQ